MNEQKFKNLPNQISTFRLICTPLVILMYLLPIANGIGVFVALGLFIIGSISDMVDGHIARKYNLVSDLGKLLDSLADKFLQTAGLILVLMSEIIEPQWIAILILLVIVLRDILINGIRQVAATKGTIIAADMFGKIKTIFIDVAVTVLMLYTGLIQVLKGGEASQILGMPINYILTFGFALLVVGACLSMLSCINYTYDNWSIIFGEKKKIDKNEPKSTEKNADKKK